MAQKCDSKTKTLSGSAHDGCDALLIRRSPSRDDLAVQYADTPATRIFDLCQKLQLKPEQFDELFPRIQAACMILAQAAPSFGPLILNLGYHLSRFDYASAVERARQLLYYEDDVLSARGQTVLETVFDELAGIGRYN